MMATETSATAASSAGTRGGAPATTHELLTAATASAAATAATAATAAASSASSTSSGSSPTLPGAAQALPAGDGLGRSESGGNEAPRMSKYKRVEKIGEGTYGTVYKALVLDGPLKGECLGEGTAVSILNTSLHFARGGGRRFCGAEENSSSGLWQWGEKVRERKTARL